MTASEVELLKTLCRTYGTYAVIRQITDSAVKVCDTDYAGNPDAVIHKDTDILVDACQEMRRAHLLR